MAMPHVDACAWDERAHVKLQPWVADHACTVRGVTHTVAFAAPTHTCKLFPLVFQPVAVANEPGTWGVPCGDTCMGS